MTMSPMETSTNVKSGLVGGAVIAGNRGFIAWKLDYNGAGADRAFAHLLITAAYDKARAKLGERGRIGGFVFLVNLRI